MRSRLFQEIDAVVGCMLPNDDVHPTIYVPSRPAAVGWSSYQSR
jgi:hypothetical protein